MVKIYDILSAICTGYMFDKPIDNPTRKDTEEERSKREVLFEIKNKNLCRKILYLMNISISTACFAKMIK